MSGPAVFYFDEEGVLLLRARADGHHVPRSEQAERPCQDVVQCYWGYVGGMMMVPVNPIQLTAGAYTGGSCQVIYVLSRPFIPPAAACFCRSFFLLFFAPVLCHAFGGRGGLPTVHWQVQW